MPQTCDTYQLIAIHEENQSLFLEYAREHRYDHDESDLYEESLQVFDPEKQPTFVLLDAKQVVVGAVSVRILPYLEDKKRARLAMLHVTIDAVSCYGRLLDAALAAIGEVDHLFGFMPERKAIMAEIMPALGFEIERYVWVLTRGHQPIGEVILPEGYKMTTLKPQTDENDWCQVRNEAFKSLKGSETPLGHEGYMAMLESPGHLEEGMLLLWQGEKAVGVVRVSKETEESIDYGFIGPVAVLPDYQGKGLGRALLRASLHRSKALGLDQAMLCVNADNARAADLYLQEGFEKSVVMICYRMNLTVE